MNTDMILDMDTFDFSKIMDEGDSKAPTPGDQGFESQRDNYGLEGDDAFVDTDEADVEDWFDEDGEEVEDEVEGEDPFDHIESLQDLAAHFDTVPDDMDITIGGQVVKKGAVADIISRDAEVKAAYTEMEAFYNNVSNINRNIDLKLESSKMEADRDIEYWENLLNKTREDDHVGFAKNQRNLNAAVARRNKIHTDASAIIQEREARDQEMTLQRIRDTSKAMVSHKGWKGQESFGELGAFASEMGMNEHDFLKVVGPGFMKIVLEAKKYQDLNKRSKTRIEAQAATKAPRSSSSKPAQKQIARKRSVPRSAIAGSAEWNPSEAFKYLVD